MEYKVIEGGGITSPKGFTAGAVYVGVKSRKSQKPDVAVLYSETEASCAAVFTTNKFCAAPVILDREILKNGKARAIVINSGNANAATGTQGIEDARTVEREAEKLLGVGENEVFVCSTGVIGQKLPVEKVLDGVRQIIPAKLDKANGSDAAYAIMTTDTVRKESAYELELSSGTIRIGAMAKGSGMIHPNMATTLAYVTTDAKCDSADLQKMLHNAIDKSFNMCTVDGDTSTNDTMILLANGASGVEVKTEEDKAALAGLIEHICIDMARRIASDGEGATHLIVVESYGLPTEHDARLVAKAIAGSTLFKAAVFGRDAASGTRSAFEEILGIEDKCAYLNEYSTTGDVIGNVASNPNAIGYASLSAVNETVTAVAVDGVAPSEATVADGSFPIQRPFVIVTVEGTELSAEAKAFLDYAMSAEVAEIIAAAGAVSANA